eukprot:EG_transcript_7183
MAVTLSLKAIVQFNEAHPDAVYDEAQHPVEHFHELFATLFSIRHPLPLSGPTPASPLPHVAVLSAFLREVRGQRWWARYRLHRYCLARRCLARFLLQCAAQRRARLRTAVHRWEEHESWVLAEQYALDRSSVGFKWGAQPQEKFVSEIRAKLVPYHRKVAIIAALHRDTVRACAEERRAARQEQRELEARQRELSRRVAKWWLQGRCRGRAVTEFAVRLYGIQRCLEKHCAIPCKALDAAWRAVPVSAFEEACLGLGPAEEPPSPSARRVPPAARPQDRPEGGGGKRGKDEAAAPIPGVGDHVSRMLYARYGDETDAFAPVRVLSFKGTTSEAHSSSLGPSGDGDSGSSECGSVPTSCSNASSRKSSSASTAFHPDAFNVRLKSRLRLAVQVQPSRDATPSSQGTPRAKPPHSGASTPCRRRRRSGSASSSNSDQPQPPSPCSTPPKGRGPKRAPTSRASHGPDPAPAAGPRRPRSGRSPSLDLCGHPQPGPPSPLPCVALDPLPAPALYALAAPVPRGPTTSFNKVSTLPTLDDPSFNESMLELSELAVEAAITLDDLSARHEAILSASHPALP